MLETLNRMLTVVITASLLVANGYAQKDVELLANIMYLENGSTGKTEEENRQVLILTGSVVINRVKSGQWGGNSIEKVLYSPGQYAVDTKNRIGKVQIPDYVYDLARDLLAYGSNIPDYVCYQSTQKDLGYIWKVIDNEYFACAEKGHLHEGDDWIAAIDGVGGYDRGTFPNIFGDKSNIKFIGTSMAIIWGNVYSSLVGSLGMVN